jgi:beta-glucuronidase
MGSDHLTRILFVHPLLALFLATGIVSGLDSGAETGAAHLRGPWLFFFAATDSSSVFATADSLPQCDTITLPHTFPRQDTAGPPPAGIGWYFTDIPVTPAFAGKDVFIEFGGVCLRADVFVNGTAAGKSPFPYMPFRVDCTRFAQGTETIRLAVRVDNRLRDREFPDTRANGWWRYGGLVREVKLSAPPKQRIDRVALRTFHRSGDTFDLHILLAPARTLWDSVTMIGITPAGTGAAASHTLVMIGTDTTVRCPAIKAWTPDAPRRYEFSLIPWFGGKPGDTVRIRRGFCQLTAKGSRLFLNGEPAYLRGVSRHDVQGDRNPVPDRRQRLKDLLDLKNLGVNFLRIAHFPQHDDIYELCDSLGILVMDEAPVWKTDAAFLSSREGRAYGAAYMRALCEAHGNYTSICLWSLGNQFPSYQEKVAEYVDSVARATRAADSSRLVTYCSYYYQWDKGFPYVDVISINEYFGWELASLPMLSMVLDKIHREWPNKPIVISEFGPQAGLGVRNPAPQLAGMFRSVLSKDLSEEHQALYLLSHIDTIWSRRSFVSGMAVWAYADYRSYLNKARTGDMAAGLNACGIVTEDRKKKLSHQAMSGRYASLRAQWVKESGSGKTGCKTSR